MLGIAIALLLQVAPATPGEAAEVRTWTGCVQAGTAPSTYRLNLDEERASAGMAAAAQNPLGRPFVHLVSAATEWDLTEYVGKRVRVEGRRLLPDEAAREAASRPDRQEAAETAAGTGGESPQHLRYVQVKKLHVVDEDCGQ
jgi:hypothetical protein